MIQVSIIIITVKKENQNKFDSISLGFVSPIVLLLFFFLKQQKPKFNSRNYWKIF